MTEAALRVLILDGHPDEGRLTAHLLDHYAASIGQGAVIRRLAARDLVFDPNLRRGFGADQAWEPDLGRVAAAIDACDHIVIGFPLWWGSEPTLLKGLLDRLLLPGFAFRYHRGNPFWDRLLAGRSADLLITMDTPPWYLRAIYGDPVSRRWRHQVLGFCGFSPIRVLRLGPTRRGGAARRLPAWRAEVERTAGSAASLKRGRKQAVLGGRADFAEAVADRRS